MPSLLAEMHITPVGIPNAQGLLIAMAFDFKKSFLISKSLPNINWWLDELGPYKTASAVRGNTAGDRVTFCGRT